MTKPILKRELGGSGSHLNGLLPKWLGASAMPHGTSRPSGTSTRRYLFLKLQGGHIFGVLSQALGD